MKMKPQTRSFNFDRMDSVDEENRTIELSFSSEEPYERYFGIEILDHDPNSVDLARLNGKAPVLVNHDPDKQIGVIESARIDSDRRGRAMIRFGKSALAEEIWQDVKDGIRNLVSVGYRINEMAQEGKQDGVDVFRVNSWMPAEVSIVAVPADASVGVGRAFESQTENDCEVIMTEETKTQAAPEQKSAPVLDMGKIQEEVRHAELERSNQIRAMGEKFGVADLAKKHIEEGKDVESMRDAVLAHLEKNGATPVQQTKSDGSPDLSKKEVRQYSLLRAINAFASGNWKDAGLERDASIAMADRIGKDPQGFYVPTQVLSRALDTTTANTAAELVGTDHRDDMFIDLLRPRTTVMEAGARVLSGLVGNVNIPKQSGGATFQWLAEGGAVTATDPTTGTVSLTPKTVAGATEMTRRLLLQSAPSVDRMVVNDLLAGMARAIDIAALNGGGTNEPTGIAQTAGVGSVTLAGTVATRDELVDLETAIRADNVEGDLRFIFNRTMEGGLKKAKTDAGSGIFLLDGTDLIGNPFSTTNQMPTGGIILGSFSDLLIGQWGGLDVAPDSAALASSGGLVIRVFCDLDVAVRHAESFAVGDQSVTVF